MTRESRQPTTPEEVKLQWPSKDRLVSITAQLAAVITPQRKLIQYADGGVWLIKNVFPVANGSIEVAYEDEPSRFYQPNELLHGILVVK